MDLQNTKALITGGSKGIGFAIARKLTDEGGDVTIAARNKDQLEESAEKLGAHAIQADVSREADVKQLVRETIDKMDGFNTLINNAGQGSFAQLEDIDPDEMRRIFNINTVGSMMAAREAASHFKEESYGNIINISSTAGKKGFAGGTVYCASKFAMEAMTQCWRSELREHNIRVMQINPSEVQTGFGGREEDQNANPSKLIASDIADTAASMLSMADRGFMTETSVWATNPK
jgi:3-oxoacyl-[acyl-carrier protein] reductase